MQWDDIGYLISKNKYSENSIIAEIYTLEHGKSSGIIYGGTSRKIRNYLQLGNKLHVNYKSRNASKVGYFKIEISNPISPYFFDNKEKMLILNSSINLLKLLTPEFQKNINIFNLISSFLENLKILDANIISDYIFWELNLLKELGYDLNLDKFQNLNSNNQETVKISIDNDFYEVPYFLINKDSYVKNNRLIHIALIFVGKYLNKEILIPNNLNYPKFRNNLQFFYKNLISD